MRQAKVTWLHTLFVCKYVLINRNVAPCKKKKKKKQVYFGAVLFSTKQSTDFRVNKEAHFYFDT